jgi:hypothetical protein
MSLIPYRFREATFRRYEPLITEIVACHPRSLAVDANKIGLSPETLSARLRDAVKSLLVNKWPTNIDTAKLSTFWPDYQVSVLYGGIVQIGYKSGTTGRFVQDVQPTKPVVTKDLMLIEFLDLVVAYHSGSRIEPTTIKHLPVTSTKLEEIRTLYPNCVITINPDDSVTLY